MVLHLDLGERGYDITVERGALSRVGEIFSLTRRVLIVTDSGVPAVYAETVAAACKNAVIATVDAGEESKSFRVFEGLCRLLLDEGFTRSDCVVAVGGGVVGDLAGFVAASYMRGIDFYNVPTTLLSQVDSSIGGKVAINLDSVKNIVGAFKQPRGVLIDPDVLLTLPPRQISAGLAEAVKMSLTSDADGFALFESGDVAARLDEIIINALKIKKSVVEADECEGGLRKVLNFGHTVGHGIESAAGLGGLLHGECVALGMLPMCSQSVRARLIPVLERLSLPTRIEADADVILEAMGHDKKLDGEQITAVYVSEIGSFEFLKMPVSELKKQVREALEK